MGASATLEALGRAGVLAIVRLDSADQLSRVAEAVREGGVTALEFTLTTPGALDALRQAAARMGSDMLLGAGTVLDAEQAREAIAAGAQLIVSPILAPDVAAVCQQADVLCMPAGFTPTELQAAWKLGTGLVKLFPASVGGPSYLREVRAPLPHLRLAPTGGVNLETAAAFIRAGAFALGVGSALVDRALVANGDFAALTDRAKRLTDAVGSAH